MKVTVITGATGGLGRALASLYAADGENLVLVATTQQKLDGMKEELQQAFPTIAVDTFACDLADPKQVQAAIAYVESKAYFVARLVNNAGFGDCNEFAQMDPQLQLDMISVNCAALTAFMRAFIPPMLERDEGRILNVGSIASFVPGPYMSTYHATKAYVLTLGDAVAYELRRKSKNVRLTTLCPGPFDSGFVGRAKNDYTFAKIKPIPAEKVAQVAYKASKKGKASVVVGFGNKVTVFAPRFVSRAFTTKCSAKMARKGG